MSEPTYTEERVTEIVDAQREYFLTGATLDVRFRKEQLKKLKNMVEKYEDRIIAALCEDLGRSPTEAYLCDVGMMILEINETIRGLSRWARPERHFSGLQCFPSVSTKVYKMPYGVTLILSPFNFPILLCLGVLIAAIAGGNTAVLKVSSKSRACSALTAEMIAATFPPEYVTVVEGGHDVADMCLAQRFDKIFYTGSPKVARHVLSEAARNLTPCALELGGETGNWAVVRADADLEDAAPKIVFFKLLNAGQICINVNQIGVAAEVADRFVDILKAEFARQIGKNALENDEYPKLINAAAYRKCRDEAELYRDRIVCGGYGDEDTCKYAPTIIYPVDVNEPIVQHELFSPLLPVVTFPDAGVDALFDTMSRREKPLAMYVFTKDLKWANRVMRTMQYGGGCINEVCYHMIVKGVPFNGRGHSGMGAYHGEWGFREFTHPQTVLTGKTFLNLPLRLHPYGGKKNAYKMKLIRTFEK